MVRKSTSCITMDENVFILWITKTAHVTVVMIRTDFWIVKLFQTSAQGASQQEEHDVRHINSGNSAVSSAASPTACRFCAGSSYQILFPVSIATEKFAAIDHPLSHK